ncbi:hypothetical protein [Acidaminococcus sp. LBK-2]|uniref:hypothetical protein n=1 Tax=Acidaminococcus sp. LBK-2 TaxID=3456956 RepID=UPI003FA45973
MKQELHNVKITFSMRNPVRGNSYFPKKQGMMEEQPVRKGGRTSNEIREKGADEFLFRNGASSDHCP